MNYEEITIPTQEYNDIQTEIRAKNERIEDLLDRKTILAGIIAQQQLLIKELKAICASAGLLDEAEKAIEPIQHWINNQK